MTSRVIGCRKWLMSALTVPVLLLTVSSAALAGNDLDGQWSLTINIPVSPGSQTNRTFTVTLDVSPRGESLNGRVKITDQAGRTVGGAWRQVGKNCSIAYELPCPGDGPCASLILLGRIKGGGALIKRGTVIVMWDTLNARNPALYETSNGSFRGDRVQ